MKKQYKSIRIKNHKITHKIFFDGVPLNGYVRFWEYKDDFLIFL